MSQSTQYVESGSEQLHGWFGLSYANYLVIPRSLMQSMPDEWQAKMTALLRECDEAIIDHKINWPPEGLEVHVELRPVKDRSEETDDDLPAIHDDLSSYERGRRRLW